MANKYPSIAIRILLITSVAVLALNFACARGAGVQILELFGSVPTDQVTLKSNVLKGVSFMQTLIKIIAGIGVILFTYFAVKGWKRYKADNFGTQ